MLTKYRITFLHAGAWSHGQNCEKVVTRFAENAEAAERELREFWQEVYAQNIKVTQVVDVDKGLLTQI